MSVLKPRHTRSTNKIGLVDLFNKVVCTTSGAIGSQTPEGSAGFVVSKPSGTGIYRITTTDQWAEHWDLRVLIYNAGTARGQHAELKVKYGASTAKVLDFHIVSDAGSAEDMTTGDEMWITLTMKNTAVGP